MNCKNFNIERMDKHINENIANILSMKPTLEQVVATTNDYRNQLVKARGNTRFISTCYFIWSCTEKIMTWTIDNSLETLLIYDFLESIGDTKNADIVLKSIMKTIEPVTNRIFDLQDVHSQKNIYLMVFSQFMATAPNLDLYRFKNFHVILQDLIM